MWVHHAQALLAGLFLCSSHLHRLFCVSLLRSTPTTPSSCPPLCSWWSSSSWT